MAAYLVIQTLSITDPDTYDQYRAQARPLIEAAGGEYLLVGKTVHPYSGDWSPLRVVMIRFKDVATLKACFDSPAYRAIAPLRKASVVGQSVIVED
ncbi:DUF1330 domain-containing protein [Megalodesulfovibrio gigas]|uniref:DUF1330 domain-containing protein n=1 Tax=Megalodesulfovibrio gigas (strain ATCC 19364 / DSM 1382 / NCIMB 9332 / VKM B-1759) TaxID=1121448 RepID=T2G6Z5_MEGG1|nr:DUF1330 domain-containing protein [Megalodesulfovibrio gigas]AGW11969.1 hypothetical protein DGI_0028 [Megalodesulfovibrio gigas DSM 1382 = ATCC 19364]